MMCNSTQKVLTFRSTLRKAMENKYANWLIPEDLTWRKVFFKGQAMHPKMSDSCLCRKRKRKKGNQLSANPHRWTGECNSYPQTREKCVQWVSSFPSQSKFTDCHMDPKC